MRKTFTDRSRVLDESFISRESVVLEIGAGNGFFTEAIAERAKKVIAVELQQGMVRKLKKRVQRFGDAVEIVLKDIASIEHGHANDRCDDYCSVAYWYQTLTHKRIPKLPKWEDRLPRPDVRIHKQAVDAPLPITDGRHHSGMPFFPMDLVPQKTAKKSRRKKK